MAPVSLSCFHSNNLLLLIQIKLMEIKVLRIQKSNRDDSKMAARGRKQKGCLLK
jgi:hypothetical protein